MIFCGRRSSDLRTEVRLFSLLRILFTIPEYNRKSADYGMITP